MGKVTALGVRVGALGAAAVAAAGYPTCCYALEGPVVCAGPQGAFIRATTSGRKRSHPGTEPGGGRKVAGPKASR